MATFWEGAAFLFFIFKLLFLSYIYPLPYITADNQLNAKPRLSKDVRMQHFRFHKEDAINVNKVHLFRIYRECYFVS